MDAGQREAVLIITNHLPNLLRREAGCDSPASLTAVHFQDNGINRHVLARRRCFGPIWLICVVIHFASATWAFHFLFQIDELIATLSLPWRKVLDIQMSSARNFSIRRK